MYIGKKAIPLRGKKYSETHDFSRRNHKSQKKHHVPRQQLQDKLNKDEQTKRLKKTFNTMRNENRRKINFGRIHNLEKITTTQPNKYSDQ